MNVQIKVHKLRKFITHLLVHIHQKKKIALGIATMLISFSAFIFPLLI
jgi:hypothetical protein